MRVRATLTKRTAAVVAAAMAAATLAALAGAPAANAAIYQERLWPSFDVADFGDPYTVPGSTVIAITATSDNTVYARQNDVPDTELVKYPDGGGGERFVFTYSPGTAEGDKITNVWDLEVDAADNVYVLASTATKPYVVARFAHGSTTVETLGVQGPPKHPQLNAAHLGVSPDGQHMVITQTPSNEGLPKPTAYRYDLAVDNLPHVVAATPGNWSTIRGMDFTSNGDLWGLTAQPNQSGGRNSVWRLPAGSTTWTREHQGIFADGHLNISPTDVVTYWMSISTPQGGDRFIFRRLPGDPRPWTISSGEFPHTNVMQLAASASGDIFSSTGFKIIHYPYRGVDAPDDTIVAIAGEPRDLELEVDAGGQPQELVLSVVDQPDHGTLSGTAPNLTYTPDADFAGTDTFTYEAAVMSTKDTGTVTIEVLPPGGQSAVNWRRIRLNDRAGLMSFISLANLGQETAYGVTVNLDDLETDYVNTRVRINGWRSDGTIEETGWSWRVGDYVNGATNWPVALEGGPDGNLYGLSSVTNSENAVIGLAVQKFTPGDPTPETLWNLPIATESVWPRIGVGPDLAVYITLDGDPRFTAEDPSRRVLKLVPGQPGPTELPTPANGWASVADPEVAADGTVYVTGLDGVFKSPDSRGGIWKLAPGATDWELIHSYPVAALGWDGGPNPMHLTRSGLIAFSDDHLRIKLLNPDNGIVTTVGRVPKYIFEEQPLGDITSDPSGAIYASRAYEGPLYRFVPPRTDAAQEITFPQPADLVLGGADGELSASAPGGTVTYNSDTEQVCTVTGNIVHAVSAGECSVTASQAGGPGYLPAEPVTRTLTVAKRPQAITFPQPADLSVGDPAATLSAVASSGLPVTYVTTTPAQCTVSGDELTPVGAGECVVVANQAGDANTAEAEPVIRTARITKASQSLFFSQPSDTVFEGADAPLSATTSSGLPVTFTSQTPAVCTVVNNAAHPTGAGTCTIIASQPGDANYEAAAPQTRSLAVAKARVVVTTTSTSSLLSLLTLRITYTTVVKSAITGAPIAGALVTTRIDGGSPTSGCSATTTANGVATCVSGPVGIALLTTFKANVATTSNYLPGSATGRTPLF